MEVGSGANSFYINQPRSYGSRPSPGLASSEFEDSVRCGRYLLLRIFDTDPGVVQSGRAKNVISASAIREIPFEWDSEAISVCIDQMTADDAIPPLLKRAT
jgi:hypothetical protein